MPATKVPTQGDITSTNFNALIDDLRDTTTGHDHDGSDSKQVDHNNLLNKGSNNHAAIDSHIAAGSNVHNLGSGVYVAGSKGSQLKIDKGSATWTVDSGTDTSPTISFTSAFSSAPTVILQLKTVKTLYVAVVQNVTTTGFEIHLQVDEGRNPVPFSITFDWIAIGP